MFKKLITSRLIQVLVVILLTLLIVYVGTLLIPVISQSFLNNILNLFSIFIIGAFLAYIFNFAVVGIQKKVKSRNLAVLIFLFIVFGVIIGTFWIIFPQMLKNIPKVYLNISSVLSDFKENEFIVKNNISIPDIATFIPNQQILIATIWSGVVPFLGMILVTIICLFEYPNIVSGIKTIMPIKIWEAINTQTGEINRRMGKFVRDYGRLLLVLFIEHLFITIILGLNPLISFSVIIFYLIPIVGGFMYLGTIFLLAYSSESHALLFSLISVPSPMLYAVIVVGVFSILFIWDSVILMPKFIGDALKISFLVVLFVTILMSQLNWIGLMLSPFVLVLLKYFFDYYIEIRDQSNKIFDFEEDERIEIEKQTKKIERKLRSKITVE